VREMSMGENYKRNITPIRSHISRFREAQVVETAASSEARFQNKRGAKRGSERNRSKVGSTLSQISQLDRSANASSK
jgi:hypothetical protein